MNVLDSDTGLKSKFICGCLSEALLARKRVVFLNQMNIIVKEKVLTSCAKQIIFGWIGDGFD